MIINHKKINAMTLLKVYNKNGQCRQNETFPNGLPGLLSDLSFRDYYKAERPYSSPRVNIKESQDAFLIEAEVPGIDKSHLKMNLSKDILTISYKPEQSLSDENYRLREFDFANFERSFRISESVNRDKISASYSEGILLVNLPKRDEAIDKGPRSIEIS